MTNPPTILDAIYVKAGDYIFMEGDTGEYAFLLESGRVEINLEREGKIVVLAERGPGEIFGEMAIIDDQPRSASIRAIEDCELLVITREQLGRRIEECDPILRVCVNVMLERFRATIQQLNGYAEDGETPPSAHQLASKLRMSVDDQDGGAAAIAAIRLERELEVAIRDRAFELFYQPIVDFSDGSLAGFESLTRWRHPTRGLVPPGMFIPAAESSGLIVPLGRILLDKACRGLLALVDVKDQGAFVRDDMFVSFNLSGRDFDDDDLVENIMAIVNRTGADPYRMKLEITETTLMQRPDRAARALEECRLKGLSIAIDDFGAGYSSLGYLHQFPIDTLKIDRSFILAMRDDSRSMKIVQSVLSMADDLNIPVVAEGVETADDAAILRDMGCAFGQGYFFARPMPRLEAMSLLSKWQAPELINPDLRALTG